MAANVTVRVDVEPFMDGERLTAARLNELVSAINGAAHASPSLQSAVLGVAAAAVASPRRVSRRRLLGLRCA